MRRAVGVLETVPALDIPEAPKQLRQMLFLTVGTPTGHSTPELQAYPRMCPHLKQVTAP